MNTCCVPSCKTGYRAHKTTEKIPPYRFPENEDLKQHWIKATPRKNCTLSTSHKVCAKHFDKKDFVTTALDCKESSKLALDSEKLSQMRLKRSAVPHVFPSLPKYLSVQGANPRSTASSSNAKCCTYNALILKKK